MNAPGVGKVAGAAARGRRRDPAIQDRAASRHRDLARRLRGLRGRALRACSGPRAAASRRCSRRSRDSCSRSRAQIRLAGKPIERPGSDRMMVFQEFDQLLPWKTVLGNVLFPLLVNRRMPKAAGDRARARAARQGQPDAVRGRLSAHALGRHEAARRDRARARDGAGGAADGRAVRGARRADPAQDAGGADGAVGRCRASRCCSSPIRSRRRCWSAAASSCCRRIPAA